MVTRWYFVNSMPLIWDITSILSILILHKMSFSEPSKRVPKGGHYNSSGGLPNIEDNSSAYYSSFVSSDGSQIHLEEEQSMMSPSATSQNKSPSNQQYGVTSKTRTHHSSIHSALQSVDPDSDESLEVDPVTQEEYSQDR